VACDERQRAALAGAADVDRRVRALQRPGQAGCGVEPVVPAGERRRVLGEQQPQHLEGLP